MKKKLIIVKVTQNTNPLSFIAIVENEKEAKTLYSNKSLESYNNCPIKVNVLGTVVNESYKRGIL